MRALKPLLTKCTLVIFFAPFFLSCAKMSLKNTLSTDSIPTNFSGPTNMLFAGSSESNFYALDAVTGQLKWKYTGKGWFSYAS
ncbi:MAG TPA: hypothetical protein VHZ50_17965, partial [Puia sp.]|nr:hypothetical protein [Puia sp.]